MCQAPGVSNRLQWSAYDKGSCTEEPGEVESLTPGSEAGVGVERPLPTVTEPTSLASLATRLRLAPLRRRRTWGVRLISRPVSPLISRS
jgi:hypothetical protein